MTGGPGAEGGYGVMFLSFYLSWTRGDGLWGCQKPRGNSPSSISPPDGVRWGEKGSAVKSNGKKSGGSIRTWWKNTVSAREKCRENVSGWEKKSKRREKKKRNQDVLSGAVVEDTFMRHKDKEGNRQWKQTECSVWPSPLLNSVFPFTSPHIKFAPSVTAVKQPGF